MNQVRRLIAVSLAMICIPRAFAGDAPVLTLAQGEVMILASPQSTAHEEAPAGFTRSKFQGKYYLAKRALLGDALEYDSYIRTLPGARARLVFPNGDQFNVGPASFFKIEKGGSAGKGKSEGDTLKMDYGMVRAIISKGGPRSNFRVRTPSAVMGVRGTDFVVEGSSGPGHGTSLTLIRGAVALAPVDAKGAGAKPQEIKAGETAFTEKSKVPEKFATSQAELKRVVVLTEKSATAPVAQAAPEVADKVAEAVQKLESQARESTVKDLVRYAQTPEEKAKLEKLSGGGADARALNDAAVELRVEKAPVDSPGLKRIIENIKKSTKRSAVELKDLEKDPYGTYFEGTQKE
jgi:hypothetical protein